jgi:hypothetical protein
LQALNRVRTYLNKEGSLYIVQAPHINRENAVNYFGTLSDLKMNPSMSPEYYKILSAMMLRDKKMQLKFIPYIINELTNMGFSIQTSNMNSENTIPFNGDLIKFAKFGIKIAQQLIEETYAEFNCTSIRQLRALLSSEQLVEIFKTKAPNKRHLTQEHESLIAKFKADENGFKNSEDLPYEIGPIIEEYKISCRFRLTIKEFENLSNLEYLGSLTLKGLEKSSVNWKDLSYDAKKKALELQGIYYLDGVAVNLTNPEDAIKFHEQKTTMSLKHDSLINTADKCNVVITDVINIADKKYAQAGITFIKKARDEFNSKPKDIPLPRKEIVEICKKLSQDIPDFENYLTNNAKATQKTIQFGGAYINALKLGGISLVQARKQIDGTRARGYHIKIGNNTGNS